LFETGSHYVAQVGLEVTILLPQPPEYWITGDHHYSFAVLGVEFRAFHMLGKYSTTELPLQPLLKHLIIKRNPIKI
jgi:hypothetical protein